MSILVAIAFGLSFGAAFSFALAFYRLKCRQVEQLERLRDDLFESTREISDQLRSLSSVVSIRLVHLANVFDPIDPEGDVPDV